MNIYYVAGLPYSANDIYHHGIKGQKWGIRRFQNLDGTLTPEGIKRYGIGESKNLNRKENSIFSKDKNVSNNEPEKHGHKVNIDKQKVLIAVGATAAVACIAYGYYNNWGVNSEHYKYNVDQILKSGVMLNTLSMDPDRTKDTDMFYASFRLLDKMEYKAWFGTEDGSFKTIIKNKVLDNIKVASEKSAANTFSELYSKDSDFRDFILNKKRMEFMYGGKESLFGTNKGYDEALNALDNIRKNGQATRDEIGKVYRLFNMLLPLSNGRFEDDKEYEEYEALSKDMNSQRKKLFDALKKAGYGAILDTNDALYGGLGTTTPVIVIDPSKIILQSAEKLTLSDQTFSTLASIGRMVVGV